MSKITTTPEPSDAVKALDAARASEATAREQVNALRKRHSTLNAEMTALVDQVENGDVSAAEPLAEKHAQARELSKAHEAGTAALRTLAAKTREADEAVAVERFVEEGHALPDGEREAYMAALMAPIIETLAPIYAEMMEKDRQVERFYEKIKGRTNIPGVSTYTTGVIVEKAQYSINHVSALAHHIKRLEGNVRERATREQRMAAQAREDARQAEHEAVRQERMERSRPITAAELEKAQREAQAEAEQQD